MIFINTSFILNPKTGVGVYATALIDAMKINGEKYECLDLKLPNWVKYKYYWQILWLNTFVYLYTLIKKPKVFISPSFLMPYFKVKGTKYLTVIHDLTSKRQGEMISYAAKINNASIDNTIKRADIIVSVSETVKNELIKEFNVNPDRIKVVYNSIADYFINSVDKPEIYNKYGLQNQKYILSVATLNKRKNIPELIKAFESISDKYPDIKLVLVGGMGNENREKLTKHPNIIFTGYIKDEDLPILYKSALLYIFPSLYEGFGIPLIEAQHCGCPVLCTDIPVFREVADNSAEYCSTEAKGIAEKIEYLINNPKRLEEMITLGKENVKRFYIEKIAEQQKAAIN